MKHTLAAVLVSTALVAPAFAADTFTADPTHTYPSFEINHLGFSITRGTFLKTSGINPHAGESGMLGREEIEIIAPAISRLPASLFTGPISPDTVFHRAVRGEFDGVLCMYHDQGLIPLKLHAFDEGVNVTLGLPFPRTSPDHGTAFEIAGQGIARADSMIAAIRLAAELSVNRTPCR